MARIVSKWMGLAALSFFVGGVAARADFADRVVEDDYSVDELVETLQKNPEYADQLRKIQRELKERAYSLKEKQLSSPDQRADLKNKLKREEGKRLIHEEVQRYVGAALSNSLTIGKIAGDLEKKIVASTGAEFEAKQKKVKDLEVSVASLEKRADPQVKEDVAQVQQQIDAKEKEKEAQLKVYETTLSEADADMEKNRSAEVQAESDKLDKILKDLKVLEGNKAKALGNGEWAKAQKALESAKADLNAEIVAEDDSSATRGSPVKLAAVYDREKQTVRYELRPNQGWLKDNYKVNNQLRKAMGGDEAIHTYLSKDAGYDRALHEGGKEKTIDVKDRKPSEIATLLKDRRDLVEPAKRYMDLKNDRLAIDLDRAKDEVDGTENQGKKELKELKAKEAVIAWWQANKNSGITDECEIYKKALKTIEMTDKIFSKCPSLDPKSKSVAKKDDGKDVASLKTDGKDKEDDAATVREKLAAEQAQKAAQGAQQYSQFLEACIASMQDLQTKSVIMPIMNTVEPLLRAMNSKGNTCPAFHLVLNTFNQAKNACDPEAQQCMQNCQQLWGDPMAYQGCEAQCSTVNYELCLANQFQEPLPDKVARTVRSSLEVGKEGAEQLKACKTSMTSIIAYTNQAVSEMRRDPRLQDPQLAGKPEVIKLQRTLQEMQNQARLATFTLEALNAEKGSRVAAMAGTIAPLNGGLSGQGGAAGGSALGGVPVEDGLSGGGGTSATGARPTGGAPSRRGGTLPNPAAGVPGPNYLQQQRKK